MFSAATSRQALAVPRGTNTIDLTLSSDEEDTKHKPHKHSRPRPPVLSDDSDSDASELDVVAPRGGRPAVVDSESEDEEDLQIISSNAPKSAVPARPAARARSGDESEESIGTSSSEEEEEDDEISNDSFIVPDNKVESRPKPTSMAEALASMSFKKRPSPPPVPQKHAADLDSDQENALRKHGFLPIAKPPPKPTDPRAFHSSFPSKPFLQPKLTAPLTNRMPNQFPASSSSFSSNPNAFNLKAQPISVKAKLGAQIQQENASRGIPIDVPKNPPAFTARREEKPKVAKCRCSRSCLIVSRD